MNIVQEFISSSVIDTCIAPVVQKFLPKPPPLSETLHPYKNLCDSYPALCRDINQLISLPAGL